MHGLRHLPIEYAAIFCNFSDECHICNFATKTNSFMQKLSSGSNCAPGSLGYFTWYFLLGIFYLVLLGILLGITWYYLVLLGITWYFTWYYLVFYLVLLGIGVFYLGYFTCILLVLWGILLLCHFIVVS